MALGDARPHDREDLYQPDEGDKEQEPADEKANHGSVLGVGGVRAAHLHAMRDTISMQSWIGPRSWRRVARRAHCLRLMAHEAHNQHTISMQSECNQNAIRMQSAHCLRLMAHEG